MIKYSILEYMRTRRILKNDDRLYTQKDMIERYGASRQSVARVLISLQRQGYIESLPIIRAGRPCLGYRHVKDDRWMMALSAYEINKVKEVVANGRL